MRDNLQLSKELLSYETGTGINTSRVLVFYYHGRYVISLRGSKGTSSA